MINNIFINHVTVISQPKEGKKAGILFEFLNLDSPSEGISDGFSVCRGWLGIEHAKKFRGTGFYKGVFRISNFAGQMVAKIADVEFVQSGAVQPIKQGA